MSTAAAVRTACSSERRISSRVQLAARHPDQKRADRTHAAGFGRREQAAIEPADDKDEQQQHRPDVAQSGKALLPGVARRGGQEIRPQPPDDDDGEYVHRSGKQSRNDAGDEQLADVLLGDDAVDRKHGGRRQHGAERAAGRDHAGGERLRISVAAHLRIGDRSEGGGGSDRGARDGGKAGTGRDGRDAEPAAEMTGERIGGAEQFAAHAGIGYERAHQQKHGNDAEGVIGHRPHRGMTDDLQRRLAADEIGKAAHAHEAHGHADRHAHQHQAEEDEKSDYGDEVGAQINLLDLRLILPA